MEELFKWISELEPMEGMKYFALLCAILAVIPYSNIIAKYLIQIILRKKLEIVTFEYSVAQDVFVGRDENGSEVYMDIPSDNFFVIGSNLMLFWEVKGHRRIDITHVGEHLKGNAAKVLINENISEYTLTAYGFWGEKINTQILIPADKKYRLNTFNISAFSDHIIRKSPAINTLPITETKVNNSKFFSHLNRMRNWYREYLLIPGNTSIHCEKIVHADVKKKNIYRNIDASRLTKGYNFSTTKYNKILLEEPYNLNK